MRWIASIGALMVLAGCEPSEVETGQAVILSALPITLIGFALHACYRSMWQPMRPDLRLRARPMIHSSCLLLMLMFAVLAVFDDGTTEWLVMAFWGVGTSYVTLLVIALRVTAFRRMSKFFPYAAVLPWLVLMPLAIPLAFVGSTEVSNGYFILWALPGFFGWVAGPLVLVAIIEVVIHTIRYKRREIPTPPPPGLPRARIIE